METPQKIAFRESISFVPPANMLEDGGKHIVPTEEMMGGQIDNAIVRIEYPEEGGMLVYREGDMFPQKGITWPEALLAADCGKRALMNSIQLLLSKPVRYFLPLFAILPRSIRKRIVYNAAAQYGNLVWTVSMRASAIFAANGWVPMVREIYRVGMEMAGEDEEMQRLVKAFCVMWQHDDAYRFITQDFFEIVNVEALMENPGRELARAISVVVSRGKGTAAKFETLGKMLPIALRIGCMDNLARDFFSKIDIEKVKLDAGDWYKCMIWGGYKFRNIEDIDRRSARIMIDEAWVGGLTSIPYQKTQTA